MDKDDQERKQFLEQQLEWCKEQDCILEEIEMELYKMKEVAQYTLDHELTDLEVERLNGHLNELKNEIQVLEKQLYSVVH